MQLTALSLVLASAGSLVAAVSTQKLHNYCGKPLYVRYNSSGTTTGPFEVASQQSYVLNITGTGNSLMVQASADFNEPQPRMVFGTSTSSGTLYWSVNDVNGSPFNKFNVTSSPPGGVCGTATGYGSTVYSCTDNNILLTINGCSALAPGA